MKIEVTSSTDLDRWIAERHYLGNTPAGARIRMWILDDSGDRIGAMLWGRPNSRSYDQESILELTRMYLIDDTDHCAESKALGMARKWIRKHMPQIKGVIAYSSTDLHTGTIYRADNWFPLGLTRKRSEAAAWGSRENRITRDLAQKLRWVRTP